MEKKELRKVKKLTYTPRVFLTTENAGDTESPEIHFFGGHLIKRMEQIISYCPVEKRRAEGAKPISPGQRPGCQLIKEKRKGSTENIRHIMPE